MKELGAILDNIDQTTLLKLIKKIFKGTKFNTIEREDVTDGVKLHFKFLDGKEIVSPIIYEITDADVRLLKEKLDLLTNRVDGHDTRITKLEGDVNDLISTVASLVTRTDNLEDFTQTLNTKLLDLTQRVNTIDTHINQINNHLDEHDQDISTLEVDVANLKNKHLYEHRVRLTQSLSDTQPQLTILTSIISSSNEEIDTIEKLKNYITTGKYLSASGRGEMFGSNERGSVYQLWKDPGNNLQVFVVGENWAFVSAENCSVTDEVRTIY